MKPAHISQREANQLARDYFEYVVKSGRIFWRKNSWLDRDDVESAAMEGLTRALETFDPSIASFSTHVLHCARGKMCDLRKKRIRERRGIPRADREDEILPLVPDEIDREEQIAREDEADLVITRMIEAAPTIERKKAIAFMSEGWEVGAIARELEVNPSTVWRWRQDAISGARTAISQ